MPVSPSHSRVTLRVFSTTARIFLRRYRLLLFLLLLLLSRRHVFLKTYHYPESGRFRLRGHFGSSSFVVRPSDISVASFQTGRAADGFGLFSDNLRGWISRFGQKYRQKCEEIDSKHTMDVPRKRFAPNCSLIFCLLFLVACYFDLSVRRLFGRSVRHILIISTFFCFYGLWTHSSCRKAIVTMNTALAHTHAIGVAVYLAMFFIDLNYFILSSKKYIAPVISLHSSIVFFSVG